MEAALGLQLLGAQQQWGGGGEGGSDETSALAFTSASTVTRVNVLRRLPTSARQFSCRAASRRRMPQQYLRQVMRGEGSKCALATLLFSRLYSSALIPSGK